MKSVLLLFTSSEVGGAERSLVRMAANNSSSSISYEIATLDNHGKLTEWVAELGMKSLAFGGGKGHSRNQHGSIGWRSVTSCLKYVKENNIDAVYVMGFRASIFIRFFKLFIPSIIIVQGVRWVPNSNSSLDRVFRRFERVFSVFIDAYIFNSRAAQNVLEQHCRVSPSKLFTIYNGLLDIPTEIMPPSQKELVVLTVANLNVRKGYVEYLEVIERVVTANRNVRFVFVGRDDVNGLIQQKISEKNLNGYIDYVGFAKDVKPFLESARLFVLPSLWGEGCPTSILEAMSFGVPVVAHKIDGIPELVDDLVDGRLIQTGNIEQMAANILELVNDDNLSDSMGLKGRNKVEKEFLLSSCTNRHNAVMRELCADL